MSVLIILSPHLVERIEAFLKVGDDVEPSCRLAESCTTQLELAVRAFQTQAGTNSTKKGTAREIVGARPGEADDGNNGSEADHTDTQSGSPPESAPAPAPAVIDEDALIQLSQWALSDLGMVILKRKGLDPNAYSLIALLAGTEVYLPPSQISRLKAAEKPDKPDPYLPAYLSPRPPSLGSEYRQLTRNLTTVLNILFSIFGSAFAVYAAGTGGAGYSRETSALLAILAGGVVGVADGVLVWIFSERVKKGRAESEKLARLMGHATSQTVPRPEVPEKTAGNTLLADNVAHSDAAQTGDGSQSLPKREIRLRRRGLRDSSST